MQVHVSTIIYSWIIHSGHIAIYDDMSVADIKTRAKESVSKDARGISAMSLIKTARSQLILAKSHESKSELKSALSAYIKAASLAAMTMESSEYHSEKGKNGVVRKELSEFMEVRVFLPASLNC